MDSTRAARYQEIVASFSKEELHRLPLALEHCSALAIFLESTDLLMLPLPSEEVVEFALELGKLMAEEGRAVEEEPKLRKLRGSARRKRITQLDGLKAKRDEIYGSMVKEYLFFMVVLELRKLIFLARIEEGRLFLPEGEGLAIPDTDALRTIESMESFHRSMEEKLTGIFQTLDASYELHSRSIDRIRELSDR